MERNLSPFDILMEDGHGKRDEDLVADDMESMRQLHRDFISVLDRAVAVIGSDEGTIDIEQSFREMLFDAVKELAEEGGEWMDMPKSSRLIKWEESKRV